MTANMDGLFPPFRARVEALLRDAEAVAMGVSVVSAFRSVAYQAQLYAGAVANCKRNKAKCPPGKWVASPGHSNHGPHASGPAKGFGTAVDFGVRGVAAVSGQWPQALDTRMQALGRRFGLKRPMAWEDWHYEYDFTVDLPIGTTKPPTAAPQEDDMAPLPIRITGGKAAVDALYAALPDQTHGYEVRWRHVSGPALANLQEAGILGSGEVPMPEARALALHPYGADLP